METSRANWRKVFAVALDNLAQLVSPKQIIYCEGRDRPKRDGSEAGLDAQVLNNIFSEKYHETLFVSAGGNTELDQRSAIAISILSKVFPDVEIFVLKDRDMASGQGTDESDRQIYLQLNDCNHRVLRRWEIENYLYDKDVLREYCRRNGLEFDEASYDEFVTDIVNQPVKDETGRIKRICGLNFSISPEKFKLELSKAVAAEMPVYSELEVCIFSRG